MGQESGMIEHAAVAALQDASDGIVITDPSGTIRYVNSAFAAMTGYSSEEALGNNPRVLKSGLQSDAFYAKLWNTISSGQAWHGEVVNRRKDGTLYNEELQISPVRDASGEIASYVAIHRNASERREAEEANRNLAAVVESSEDAIITTTSAGIIVTWNGATETVFGYSGAEVIGQHISMLVASERLLSLGILINQAAAGDVVSEYAGTGMHKNGHRIPLSVSLRPVRNCAGEVATISIVLRNKSERTQFERQLRESKEMFREVFEHGHLGMCVCGMDGQFIQVNRALCRIFGYSTEELLVVRFSDLTHPDDLKDSFRMLEQLCKGPSGSLEIEKRYIHRGGSVVRGRVSVSMVKDSDGKPLYFVAHVEDITERKRSEELLRESEERFRRVVEAAPMGIYIHNDGIVRYLNPAALSMFGAVSSNQIVGQDFLDLIHPDSRPAVIERARTLAEELLALPPLEEQRLRLDGSAFPSENTAIPFRFEGRDGAVVFIRDLTEQKRKDGALSLSEATQRSLVENAPYGIFRSTPEGRILSCNSALCRILGYASEEELISINLSESVYCDPQERSGFVEALMNDRDLHSIESIWRCKDGRVITIILSGHTCRGANGERVFESFIEDITDRKRSEVELGRLNRAMSALSRCNEALVHATDEAQLLDQICEIVVRVGGYRLVWVGYTNDADMAVHVMAKAGLDDGYLDKACITWDNTPRGCGPTGTAVKSGETFVLRDIICNPQFEPWRKDAGLHGFASDIALPLKDEAHRIGALTIYAQEPDAFDDREVELLKELAANLTYGILALRSEAERKQAEKARQRSEEKFLQLAENIREVIWMVPCEPNEKPYCSPAYQAIWGRTCDSLYQNPKSWMDALHPDDLEDAKLRFESNLAGKASDAKYRIRTPDGQEKWVHDRAFPVRDQDGRLIRMVGLSADITEQKRYETELIQAREDAYAASRAKGDFLANMSHEIRTPLNGVMGMTELALSSMPDAEQREYLETIRSSADSLLTVVNDILDFSKIEAGKMELVPVNFNLRECLEDALRPLAVSADKKAIEVLCDIASEVPEVIWADFARIRQVLLNLVSNAIKFTPAGEVVVRVAMAERESESGILHFTVTDTGIGIAADKRQAIFEPFTQADTSTTRNYGGTGLGLTISARLVSMMGGRIWFDSVVGQGSQFHFTAQVKVLKGVAEPKVPVSSEKPRGMKVLILDDNATNRSLRILLAEDNRVNRVVATRMLEKAGHTVVAATNGVEAISMLALESFDLILMDVQMPEMDGFTASGKIRESEKLSGSHIPIIAMTAHAMSGDRERCLDAGMDGYLSKPVTWSGLEKAIAGVFSTQPAQENPAGLLSPVSDEPPLEVS